MIDYLKKHGVPPFVKFLGWLFILLLILEVFVRSFIIRYPHFHLVPDLGVVPVDNTVSIWGVEGFGITHYLSNGEIVTPRNSGKTSVVVLGDSYTEGLQVNDDQKYVSVAENILSGRGVDVNLHNFGASGRCFADYVYIAPFVQRTYAPEIVVLQVTETDFTESLDISRQNYFTATDSAVELVHNKDYYMFNLDLRNMLYSSGLGSLANFKLTPLIKEQRQRLAMSAAGQAKASEPGTGSENSGDQPSASQKKLDAALVRMEVDILKKAYPDAKLVFFLIPAAPVVRDDELILSDKDGEALSEILGEIPDLSVLYPYEQFRDEFYSSGKLPRGFFNTLPGAGHLNSDGNFTAGTALADYLESLVK
jgi:hypothetical protein